MADMSGSVGKFSIALHILEIVLICYFLRYGSARHIPWMSWAAVAVAGFAVGHVGYDRERKR
jgi:hypothetical protein